MKYKSSYYNTIMPLEQDRYLIFNSLKNTTAIWNHNDMEYFQQISNLDDEAEECLDIDNEFYKCGFVIDSNIDEMKLLQEQFQMNRFNQTRMTLTIAPTMFCNFKCDYCYEGESKSLNIMNEEVQDKILEFLAYENRHKVLKQLNVSWYGGEPLIAQNVIFHLSQKIMEFCKNNGIHYSAMIVTNGYLLTKEIAQKLYDYRVEVIQITIDGERNLHNQRRILLNDKPTFDIILDNCVEIIQNVPIRIDVRVNIDRRNAGGIERLFQQLEEKSLCNKPKFKLYFAPVEASTEECDFIKCNAMEKKEFAELEIKLLKGAMEKQLVNTPYPMMYRGGCAATRPKGFVILPNGDMHKCWHTVSNEEKRIGNILDYNTIKQHENYELWTKWSPFSDERCKLCKLLPNCMGACAYKYLYKEMDPCISLKENIIEKLLLFACIKGELSKEDIPDDMQNRFK